MVLDHLKPLLGRKVLMGFEVTKKNVKDVSSFLSQSEPKKRQKRKKSQSEENLPPGSWGLLRTKDRL